VAVAIAVVPLALAARDGVPAGFAIPEQAVQPLASDTAALRALVAGIRGANPIQCELIVQTFNGWFSDQVPDRDPAAWEIARRSRYHVEDRETIAWLADQLRAGDSCAGRAASRLLGRSESLAARATLLAALTDTSAQVRRLGALGLGFRDDTTTSSQLVRALSDRDARVRAAAAWALGAVN
jgi:hypothetical protein